MYVQTNKNIYWSPDLLKLQVGSLNDKLSPLEHNSFPLDSRDVTRATMLIRDDIQRLLLAPYYTPWPNTTCYMYCLLLGGQTQCAGSDVLNGLPLCLLVGTNRSSGSSGLM